VPAPARRRRTGDRRRRRLGVGGDRRVALRRLGELGFLPGEPVQLLRRGPGGREPLAVLIGETMFALRLLEAQCIEVRLDDVSGDAAGRGRRQPGRAPREGDRRQRGRIVTHALNAPNQAPRWSVALVGNPNCGKTALFNLLTGARQKVANYAGVTVERRSA
jgi:Fe2+ transport system protein FeoA